MEKENKVKNIIGWIIPILIGIIVAMVLNTFIITMIKVSGDSMYPNLYNNEHVVAIKIKDVKPNSVIVFNAMGVDTDNKEVNSKTKYVKRVIGMPGDTVEYTNNGNLYVNGNLVSQSYISKNQRIEGTLYLWKKEANGVTLGTHKKFKVPLNTYFVLGDNRGNSNDSRYYGFVPKSKVVGVVYAFPWSKNSDLIN